MKTEIEREYEKYHQINVEHYKGHSCFNHECAGVMGDSLRDSHLLTCAVCGTGLKRPPIREWVNGRIKGMSYTIQTNGDQVKYNKARIGELEEEIENLKQENRDYRVDSANKRKDKKRYVKALKSLKE